MDSTGPASYWVLDWMPSQGPAVVPDPNLLRVPPLLLPQKSVNGSAVYRGVCRLTGCELPAIFLPSVVLVLTRPTAAGLERGGRALPALVGIAVLNRDVTKAGVHWGRSVYVEVELTKGPFVFACLLYLSCSSPSSHTPGAIHLDRLGWSIKMRLLRFSEKNKTHEGPRREKS